MTTRPTPSAEALRVSVAAGKYTVIQTVDGRLSALRHGEPWRDLCGDGLVYSLASELADLRRERDELFDALCDLHAAVWLQAEVTRAESASLGAARRAAKALIDKRIQALANPAET